jgi:hypothetical protein
VENIEVYEDINSLKKELRSNVEEMTTSANIGLGKPGDPIPAYPGNSEETPEDVDQIDIDDVEDTEEEDRDGYTGTQAGNDQKPVGECLDGEDNSDEDDSIYFQDDGQVYDDQDEPGDVEEIDVDDIDDTDDEERAGYTDIQAGSYGEAVNSELYDLISQMDESQFNDFYTSLTEDEQTEVQAMLEEVSPDEVISDASPNEADSDDEEESEDDEKIESVGQYSSNQGQELDEKSKWLRFGRTWGMSTSQEKLDKVKQKSDAKIAKMQRKLGNKDTDKGYRRDIAKVQKDKDIWAKHYATKPIKEDDENKNESLRQFISNRQVNVKSVDEITTRTKGGLVGGYMGILGGPLAPVTVPLGAKIGSNIAKHSQDPKEREKELITHRDRMISWGKQKKADKFSKKLAQHKKEMEKIRSRKNESISEAVEMPDGFFNQPASLIATGLKKSSSSLKQAMSKLNDYIVSMGSSMSVDDQARLELAKRKLKTAYEANESYEEGTVI